MQSAPTPIDAPVGADRIRELSLFMQIRQFTFLLFVLFFSNICVASKLTDAEATELGYRVSAINAALHNSGAPGAMQAQESIRARVDIIRQAIRAIDLK